MTDIEVRKNLKDYNTFGVAVEAKYFVEVENETKLNELVSDAVFLSNNHLVIGNGSNILFTNDFNGLVIKSTIEGIEVECEDDDSVYLKVGSGVEWNQVIEYALQNGYYGIENLIDIPGDCGGAVVQNIGAYGVEIGNYVCKVRAFRLSSPYDFIELSNKECRFGYRQSVFKSDSFTNNYLITYVILRLSKHFVPNFQYSGVEQAVGDKESVTARDVAEAISNIRKDKLPDVKEIGSAGSFFKNPVVEYLKYKDIIEKYNLKVYPVTAVECKLSAAQMIEIAGYKGKRDGDVGVYDKHSLIVCNYGNATGEEIYQFALQIVEKVNYMFNLTLNSEVIIW